MALKIVSLLIYITLSCAWAGNGSSGVGTARVTSGFSANNLEGSIERVDNHIIDSVSREKILEITTIQKNKINFNKLVKAQFGKVHGFEYVSQAIKEKNYWVVCKLGEKTCSKLAPISNTNKKILSIMGSLVED